MQQNHTKIVRRNRSNKTSKPSGMSLGNLEKMPWTQAVQDVPVDHVLQYRDAETGDVVYWHSRQPSLQKTLKFNKNGMPSKVRQSFFDKVNLGRLFITHCP